MDTFNQKCTRSYVIQGTCCLVYHIANYIYFNLVTAALDGISVAHVVFRTSIKSIISVCGVKECIYLPVLLEIVYGADRETEYLH